MSLFDRLLEKQLNPTKSEEGVEPAPEVKGPPVLLSEEVRTAASNAVFEKKRQKWLAEALVKVSPKPKPAPDAARDELTDDDVEEVLAPRPPPPKPEPLKLDGRPLVAVGSCEAINPDTGRQCALLAGHTKAHRHGSTEFNYGAQPGQKNFRRRDCKSPDAPPSHRATASGAGGEEDVLVRFRKVAKALGKDPQAILDDATRTVARQWLKTLEDAIQ